MWNVPSRDRLAKIPKLYSTEGTPLKDKLIHLHFSLFSCDWYIAEYDGDDLFFGFAILNDDHLNSEWGIISFSELQSLSFNRIEVDCEREEFWQTKPASEFPNIKV